MYFLEAKCNIPRQIMELIVTIINLIRFAVPIMLIVIGMLDLGKAVVASKEDEIKKAQMTLIKRAIAAVLVFFIISIVTWLVSVVDKTKYSTACLCLTNADSCVYTTEADKRD